MCQLINNQGLDIHSVEIHFNEKYITALLHHTTWR